MTWLAESALWFVVFSAISLSENIEHQGVRANMPFASESECTEWLYDVENESREYAFVAYQFPDTLINFDCRPLSELGVFFDEKGV